MDRFIDGKIQQSGCYVYNLKSNMDRFIVNADFICSSTNENLKSNMDRFIAGQWNYIRYYNRFKIQYG